jgi:predicted small metal-binding protein
MKYLACGDVVPGCDARWACRTEEELLVEVAEHAASVHGISDLSPALVDAIRRAVVTVE